MYHQQQNKWYPPKRFLHAYLEATLYFSRSESSVASKWASKQLWGNIYFAVDGT